jgi:4'-phosphopantetheinyl transferase
MVDLQSSSAGRDQTGHERPIDLVLLRLVTERAPPDALAALLTEEERQRAERFRQQADRTRFICGRAALRLLLAEHLGLPAHEFRFLLTPKGKPHLDGTPIEFNLAHAGELVALAISVDTIGVDVERIGRPADPLAFARRRFAADETRRIEEAADQALEFARVWTAKEAVIKAEGTGVGLGLDRFVVPASSARWQAVREIGASQGLDRFHTAAFDTDEGYAGAIAGERPRAVALRRMIFDKTGTLIAA